MTVTSETIDASGREVALTNPGRELFGSSGITKRDLVEYYTTVAPNMLPHLRERPLALHRFPGGIDDEGFFQKRRPDHAPDWVPGVRVGRETGGSVTMIVANSAAVLAWLANQAMITAHPWLSRTGDLNRPDRLVFDLDPSGDDFGAVRRAAWDLRELLEELALPAYLMSTGSRGLHVVVPIRPERTFDEVREFARGAADLLADRHPDRLTTQVRKNQRRGRLFVDILRNSYAQHAVAPYSVRPLLGAPVATPLEWAELHEVPSAQAWTLRTVGERLEDDPWRGMYRHARSLGKAAARLARLRAG